MELLLLRRNWQASVKTDWDEAAVSDQHQRVGSRRETAAQTEREVARQHDGSFNRTIRERAHPYNVQRCLGPFPPGIHLRALGEQESQHPQIRTVIHNDRRPMKRRSFFMVDCVHTCIVAHQPLCQFQIPI
jgi:hypothetical protein